MPFLDTGGSNPIPSASGSVSPTFHADRRKDPAFAGSARLAGDQRMGRAGHEPARLDCVALTGIEAVPHR